MDEWQYSYNFVTRSGSRMRGRIRNTMNSYCDCDICHRTHVQTPFRIVFAQRLIKALGDMTDRLGAVMAKPMDAKVALMIIVRRCDSCTTRRSAA